MTYSNIHGNFKTFQTSNLRQIEFLDNFSWSRGAANQKYKFELRMFLTQLCGISFRCYLDHNIYVHYILGSFQQDACTCLIPVNLCRVQKSFPEPSSFQYSERTMASTEVNYTLYESYRTQLFGARRTRAWHYHGSDTPTSPRAILHHTDPILCTFLHTTVNLCFLKNLALPLRCILDKMSVRANNFQKIYFVCHFFAKLDRFFKTAALS